MSLYDKASLVLIPSGTKAGTVFSQKPVPSTDVLTDDTLNNGDFEQGSSGWTLQAGTVVFSNGNAEFQGSSIINQNVSGNNGKTIIVTYTVESADANARLQLYDGSWFDVEDSVGTHTVSFVSASTLFYLRNNDSGNITVSSISAKKIVDGDFDFTRSTYATRVNSQGLIEKERSNLLLQSNTFDTTWDNIVTTLTGGQSGYDGGSDAWLLNSTTTGFPRIEQSVTLSGVQTFSIYAKSATDSFIQVRTFGAVSEVWFNLSTGGVVSSSGAGYITSKAENIGSGWYRCSVTVNGSLTSVRVYPASAFTVYSTSGNGVYIQDAQLEQGLVATDYIETTTSAVYTGITDNVPRLDYDGDCPSLLLEPQRSNLIDSAEYYNGSSWSRVRSTITDNAETSPEGVDNASALIATAVNDDHYIYATPATTNAIHTYSVFLKKGNRTWARLWETTTNVFVDFNLDTGATGTTNGTIIDKGTEDFGNGWYRCYFTYDTGSAGLKVCRIYSLEGDNDRSYLGDGTTEEIYIYGAQLEEGSYATSYIPTYGTTVTRNAEDLELPTLSTVFDSSGDYTVFFEHGRIHEGVEAQFLYIRNVSCCYITISAGGSGTFTIGLWDGTNYTAVIVNDENFVVGSPIKVIVRVQNSIPSVFVNGAERTVPDTSVVPRGFHLYQFNKNHRIYKELYFNEALTDQECIDLTT